MGEIALDYIFHNNDRSSVEAYQERLRQNHLRVRFKNAVMKKWTEFKKENKPVSLSDMVNDMLRKKRQAAKAEKQGNPQIQKEDIEEKIKERK